MGAWDLTGFGVSNKDWTATGVGGGLPYEVELDQNHKFEFAIVRMSQI